MSVKAVEVLAQEYELDEASIFVIYKGLGAQGSNLHLIRDKLHVIRGVGAPVELSKHPFSDRIRSLQSLQNGESSGADDEGSYDYGFSLSGRQDHDLLLRYLHRRNTMLEAQIQAQNKEIEALKDRLQRAEMTIAQM